MKIFTLIEIEEIAPPITAITTSVTPAVAVTSAVVSARAVYDVVVGEAGGRTEKRVVEFERSEGRRKADGGGGRRREEGERR
ncbi:hypothetical protein FXO38_13886 [Capsicum annuum]|nr:hypothetical protein FXO38_13886 [Capsicum annuum]